jgi:subtilisin family serine protease
MARPPRAQSDRPYRKLQPKLRMIANGSDTVNALRAEHCGPLRVKAKELLRQVPVQRDDTAVPAPRRAILARRGTLARPASGVEAQVFVQTTRRDSPKIRGERSRKGNLITARLPLSALRDLAAQPEVTFIELGEPLAAPKPRVNPAKVRAPSRDRFGFPQRRGSSDVMIGLIDVQGFDFAHPDFLDAQGRTRFVAIWDQGGSARPAPRDRRFHYGAEFTQEQLNAALRNAPRAGVPPQDLERQSEMVAGSHGTHVASIAGGNHGVCPGAQLAGVLISLSEQDQDPRASFYDSTRLVDAVEYLLDLAARRKAKAIAINISLGTNGHAHDGSSGVSRWLDRELTLPGRCVCVAAGNAGQEAAEQPGDYGFVMGRIHTSGRIPASGLNHDLEWTVIGNGLADISENELELWYSPQDRFGVSIRTPDGLWTEVLQPGEFVENRELANGTILSVYNEVYHPANGANYIAIYLSPFLAKDAVAGVTAGQWLVRLHGQQVRNGRFHGWIERDDPRPVGRLGPKQLWNFPSFFSQRSNVDDSSVGSLGCGNNIITVANLHAARDRIHITSSQGPTRDGRFKPDVAAPGTDIVAAKGFAGGDDLWVSMTGTSMASPVVTGVAALMLSREPRLTAAQIQGIIQRTAQPLPGADFAWANDAGYGRIDPEACLREAGEVFKRKDLTK